MDNNNLDNNNNETDSRRLGGIFLIISWIIAFALVAALINNTIFTNKEATIVKSPEGTVITLQRDYDSHFRIKGSINGIPVTFLIDTGATSVAVSKDIAERADLKRTVEVASDTANGTGVGYMTEIKALKLGDVELDNVNAVIMPSLGMEEALLGMNVLSKLTVQQTQSTMTLTVPPSN